MLRCHTALIFAGKFELFVTVSLELIFYPIMALRNNLRAIRLIGSGLGLLATQVLTSCSDNQRLTLELKNLKATEVELATQSKELQTQASGFARKIADAEKARATEEQTVADAEAKATQLTKRVAYLEAKLKAINEQANALNTQVTQFQVKYQKK